MDLQAAGSGGRTQSKRRAEILGLQSSKVDFISGTITLRAGETKNDDSRTISIAAPLRTLPLDHLSKCPRGYDFICSSVDRRGIPTGWEISKGLALHHTRPGWPFAA